MLATVQHHTIKQQYRPPVTEGPGQHVQPVQEINRRNTPRPLVSTLSSSRGRNGISRFEDTGHHVIEEVALSKAGFSEDQRKLIEAGNVERDYSQTPLPGLVNSLLIGKAGNFGGYKPEEHFDNFIYGDKGWQSRDEVAAGPNARLATPRKTPIDYIKSELLAAVDQLNVGKDGKIEDPANMRANQLKHLGNAFHTIEDFFAHSNFVELTGNDKRFGSTLLTGSYDDTDKKVSLSHLLENVSTPEMLRNQRAITEKAVSATPPLSHSRIAHDSPDSNNYGRARQLAALVVFDLAKDIIALMKVPSLGDRIDALNKIVLAKIIRYLAPPTEKDKWWETLTGDYGASIDQALDEVSRHTPITVNQSFWSPLKSLEAGKNSNIHLVGPTFPTNDSTGFVQFGAGSITLEDPRTGNDNRNTRSGGFFGAQYTKTF